MQRTFLVVLLFLVVAGLGGGIWWVSHEHVPPGPAPVGPSNSTASNAVHGDTIPELEARTTLDSTVPENIGSLETTVVFPLEIELELVRGKDTINVPGAPPLGTGANAQLKGTILGPDGKGARAEVTFVAGTNIGRILYADASGAFGANDLQPGLAIVTVAGQGIAGSQREVRLRQQRESLLNISYARPARVSGVVYDAENKPLAGVVVNLDGQVTTTDDTGQFDYPLVAAGEVLALVEKPGFAAYRELVTVPSGGKLDKERVHFRLRKGARLQVSVVERLNASEQAWLYVLPEDGTGQRSFPWHLVNPTRVWPGGTATIEDLPSGSYSVRVFQAGALTKPNVARASLGPNETTTLEFHLEPAAVVQGVVKDGGQPSVAAIVHLEAPDRTQANLSVFGQSNYLFLESDVLPNLPPAVQEASTNSRGEFTLSANESISPVRYVTARSSDGKRVAHAVLNPGASTVELALAPLVSGASELRFATNPRFQALPLKVTINGAPRAFEPVPPGRDLRVDALPSGSWLVSVKWSGHVIMAQVPIELDGEVTREIELPEGAIAGQDADTVLRSGKH